ncbi:VOC family protein [Halioglobus sp. Uisw_031]|jgi:catechol 2,3-dioxygenase-like lactoylglutathione lyase family enzyme|uniref:VOC family protein n=1 Tax=Halioglobus sp. Uisw_031 TaxID=3230977 RepID=UPI0039EA9A5F
MFSHIMVGASDVNESKVFYDAILGALGHEPGVIDEKGRCFYFTKVGIFSVSIPIDGEPVSHGNGSTIGFAAESGAMADAWHAAGLANGGTAIEEPPGPRESGVGKIYLAYLRDPAGNKVCALHRMA